MSALFHPPGEGRDVRLELPRHAVDIIGIALPGLGQLLGGGQQLLSVRVGVLKKTLYGFFDYILQTAKQSQVKKVVFALFEGLVCSVRIGRRKIMGLF